MKQLLIALLCLFTLQVSAQKGAKQKGSYYLAKVFYAQKDRVIYHYQDGNDLILANFKRNGKYYDLTIKKNKQPLFSLKMTKAGQPIYQLGVEGSAKKFDQSAYEILPQELKLFLAYLEVDQQEFQPQFNGGGGVAGAGISNGIPNALGPQVDAAAGGSGEDCTQTGSCSCGNSNVTVTCQCGGVISCYERTTTACDSDDLGNPINCREVTGCAGRCD